MDRFQQPNTESEINCYLRHFHFIARKGYSRQEDWVFWRLDSWHAFLFVQGLSLLSHSFTITLRKEAVILWPQSIYRSFISPVLSMFYRDQLKISPCTKSTVAGKALFLVKSHPKIQYLCRTITQLSDRMKGQIVLTIEKQIMKSHKSMLPFERRH